MGLLEEATKDKKVKQEKLEEKFKISSPIVKVLLNATTIKDYDFPLLNGDRILRLINIRPIEVCDAIFVIPSVIIGSTLIQLKKGFISLGDTTVQDSSRNLVIFETIPFPSDKDVTLRFVFISEYDSTVKVEISYLVEFI